MFIVCKVSHWTRFHLVVSCPVFQVYYHLGAFEESLTYALGADDLFDVNDTSEYVETTIGMKTRENHFQIKPHRTSFFECQVISGTTTMY